MEGPWLSVYRGGLLLSLVLTLFVLSQALREREQPGARPLVVLATGALLYVCVKLAVSVVRGTPAVFGLSRLYPAGVGLATVGFVLLVVEYTDIENPVSGRTATALLVVPAVVSALALVDVEYLWVPVGRDGTTLSGYAWEATGVAIAQQLYLNILLLLGIALLVRFGMQSANVFRLQVGALLVAAAGPLLGNLTFRLGYVPFNPAPVLFALSALVIGWAILSARFLDLAPVGRDTVLENLDAGVLTIDDEHRLIDSNEYARRMFGLADGGALVGQHIDEVFAEQSAFRERYWSAIEGETDRRSSLEHDGRHYTVEMIQLDTSRGTVSGRSVIVRDVTEQTRREQELEQKNEQLERFASIISHDIRNPLTVIQGRVEIARQNGDIEGQLDNIADNADRIEGIIEDALVMTRKSDVQNREPVDVATVARRAWSHVETGQVTLETDCDAPIDGDPDRLIRLFENLFRNAVEHGGDITTVRVGTKTGEDGSLRGFFVADDGVGIPEADREVVMEDGYTTSDDGTGLGLSIISGIVDTHGWSLAVTESESGGARFDIEQ